MTSLAVSICANRAIAPMKMKPHDDPVLEVVSCGHQAGCQQVLRSDHDADQRQGEVALLGAAGEGVSVVYRRAGSCGSAVLNQAGSHAGAARPAAHVEAPGCFQPQPVRSGPKAAPVFADVEDGGRSLRRGGGRCPVGADEHGGVTLQATGPIATSSE